MSLQACADITAKGDPDRFAAAMAGPVAARRVLFPLYAFNVEVARAPWVTSEPMIGEMRLQWWRDALEEIGGGGTVRKHEVTLPLAEVLDREGALTLDALIAARRWDLYTDAFEDAAHFQTYLDRTGGGLMWTAARLLGADPAQETEVRRLGRAAALVRFLAAVSELEARGRVPLVDGRNEAIKRLAETVLAGLKVPALGQNARAALLEAWQTRPLLQRVLRTPQVVAEGAVRQSEFRKRLGLLLAGYRS